MNSRQRRQQRRRLAREWPVGVRVMVFAYSAQQVKGVVLDRSWVRKGNLWSVPVHYETRGGGAYVDLLPRELRRLP